MDFEAEEDDFDDELLDLLVLEPLFRLLLDELEEEDCCWEFLLTSVLASASFSGDESDE